MCVEEGAQEKNEHDSTKGSTEHGAGDCAVLAWAFDMRCFIRGRRYRNNALIFSPHPARNLPMGRRLSLHFGIGLKDSGDGRTLGASPVKP